jgi:hypothetical protein
MGENDRGEREHPQAGAGAPPAETVRCARCAHYFVTYDPAFPHGCRIAGFKSRVLPSQEMAAHSGLPCLCFTARTRRPA